MKTGYETTVELGNIKKGDVKDLYSPSVYGVGILGTKYLSTVNGVKTKEYKLWKDMLTRCYIDACKKKDRKSTRLNSSHSAKSRMPSSA